jgi:hypothetical protein
MSEPREQTGRPCLHGRAGIRICEEAKSER